MAAFDSGHHFSLTSILSSSAVLQAPHSWGLLRTEFDFDINSTDATGNPLWTLCCNHTDRDYCAGFRRDSRLHTRTPQRPDTQIEFRVEELRLGNILTIHHNAKLAHQDKDACATVTPPVWQASVDCQNINKWFWFCEIPSVGCVCVSHQKLWWLTIHFGHKLCLHYLKKKACDESDKHEEPQSFEQHLIMFRVHNSTSYHATHVPSSNSTSQTQSDRTPAWLLLCRLT